MRETLLNGGEGFALFKAVCRKPRDFARYPVLADYCEDQGDAVQAECWRLLGEAGRYPVFHNWGSSYRYWWHRHDSATNLNRSGVLPDDWLRRISSLGCVDPFHELNLKTFVCREDAFRNAVMGWRKMTVEQRVLCRAELLKTAGLVPLEKHP